MAKMRICLLVLLVYSSLIHSQNPASVRVSDSTNYYMDLARFSTTINNYKNALTYTQKAINFSKAANNKPAQAVTLLALGNLYFDVAKYTDAIEELDRCTAIFKTLDPSSEHAYAHYLTGLAQMQIGKFSEAEKHFSSAQALYETLKLNDAVELLNLQRAIVYKAKGQNDQAYKIFTRIITMPEKEDVYGIKPEAMYHIGTIEMHQRRYNMALNYLKRALLLITDRNALDLKSNIYHSLSLVYEQISDVENAHNYFKRHVALKDSIVELNREKLGAEDYQAFKESERLKIIDELDEENKQQEKESKFAKLISILAIALISILSLLSLSLYKNNIIRNQSNLLLKEKNKELQIAKDKAEKASKARSEFLSTVSHELRTPLNAINGITHLLLQENPKESQLQYLTSLKFSGDYLLAFINDILEINRIESNNVEAENINFNLKLLLANIKNSLAELSQKNNNQLLIEIGSDVPDLLIGDPIKLSQIFMNLINNALKFTHDGAVTVIAKRLSDNNDEIDLHFEIRDTGIGIPEDKQESVFESFSQGSIEINRKYGGTGLGLNIVKKLVQILGGDIKLQSRIGEGSIFAFDLTFKASSGMPAVRELNYDETIFVNKKVLLVEDNKINQMITRKMLENKQMLCEIIDNGEDAIEAVKNNYYDLVLMDVHLPGINGTVATQTIRTFDKQTRIIALTAISLNENREMLLSFGMDDVITKPFNPDEFYRIIAQNFSNRGSSREFVS